MRLSLHASNRCGRRESDPSMRENHASCVRGGQSDYYCFDSIIKWINQTIESMLAGSWPEVVRLGGGSGQVWYQNVQLDQLNPMLYHTWGWEVWNPLRPINPDSPNYLEPMQKP